MPSHPALPPEIRLRIYETCLDEYFDNKKRGVWVLPARLSSSPNGTLTWFSIHGATIRNPVPRILQVELGDMRARLLAWLARKRGLPASRRDIIYLHNSAEIALFCRFLRKKDPEIANYTLIQRVAVAASVNHEGGCPRFMENFEDLCSTSRDLLRLDELLIVFVILDDGQLVDVTSGWKGNHSAYLIEPLQTGDLEFRQDGLQQAVTALGKLVRPMLSDPHGKNVKITACKIIQRT